MESRLLLLQQIRGQHVLVRALETSEPAEEVLALLEHLAECSRELLRLAGAHAMPRASGVREPASPWDAVEGLLEHLDEDALGAAPAVPLDPALGSEGVTLRSLVSGHAGHLAWHLGQVARLRSAAGLPAMPGWPRNPRRSSEP